MANDNNELTVSGEKNITEFSKDLKGFSTYPGYVGQWPVPLTLSPFTGLKESSLRAFYNTLIERFQSRSWGTYGYFKVFVKDDLVSLHNKAIVSSYSMAKVVKVLAIKNPDSIFCHAVKEKYSTNLQIWTVTQEKVIKIHNLENLSDSSHLLKQELQEHLNNYKTKQNIKNHTVFVMGDEALGIDEEITYPLKLSDNMYQLTESTLNDMASLSELVKPVSKSTSKLWLPIFITLFLLSLGPLSLFAFNEISKSNFNQIQDTYRELASKTEGLDENGRNTAEVALWDARDTYLRQQTNKSLDTDNLAIIAEAISTAVQTQNINLYVKTIDYSRQLKIQSGVPSYHFRIDVGIFNDPRVNEGNAIDSVYKALGTALADVTEEFVTPKKPSTLNIDGKAYYRVEFYGRFVPAQLKGGNNG